MTGRASQMTGFNMMGTLFVNGLKLRLPVPSFKKCEWVLFGHFFLGDMQIPFCRYTEKWLTIWTYIGKLTQEISRKLF